jgi:iron(III) transport system permease protein
LVLLLREVFSQSTAFDPRVIDWALNSAVLAALAAAIVVPAAVLVAYALRVSRSPMVSAAARVAAAGYAVPGAVLAVGILTAAAAIDRMSGGTIVLTTTIAGVVYAYVVRFFVVGYQGVDAALRAISPSMDASARSLGMSATGVLTRVHWPLLRTTLATAAALVFVECLKELPATLALRPFNFDTLAVVAYQFASDERLSQAALPATLVVLVGLLPVLWLARRFQ